MRFGGVCATGDMHAASSSMQALPLSLPRLQELEILEVFVRNAECILVFTSQTNCVTETQKLRLSIAVFS